LPDHPSALLGTRLSINELHNIDVRRRSTISANTWNSLEFYRVSTSGAAMLLDPATGTASNEVSRNSRGSTMMMGPLLVDSKGQYLIKFGFCARARVSVCVCVCVSVHECL